MVHTRFSKVSTWVGALALGVAVFMGPTAQAAFLPGTVPTPPGSSVFPGDVTGVGAGTLLDSMVAAWSFDVPPPAGNTSGELRTAVYRNSTGTLDFYYQVVNNATSATALARESNANYAGFDTQTGFRLDGSSLPDTIFTDGGVIPFTVDRSGSGIVVGFNFGPLDLDRILPGTTSAVLVISTNAMNYTAGIAAIIDGGTATVSAFQPDEVIPEPGTYMMLAGGVGMLFLRRIMMSRKA